MASADAVLEYISQLQPNSCTHLQCVLKLGRIVADSESLLCSGFLVWFQVQAEKMTSAEDQHLMFSKMAAKVT